MTKYLVKDFETRSCADLRSVGAFKYASHPTTQIMCCSYRYGTREELAKQKTKIWCNLLRNPEGGGFGRIEWSHAWLGLVAALQDPDVVVTAHNSYFEQCIYKFVLQPFAKKMCINLPDLPPSRWLCTASLAAALALPRDLKGASLALKLKITKDTEGKRVMMKLSQPAKPSKARPVGGWYEDPEDVETLLKYCVTDLDVENELLLRLPSLTAFERRVWELDQTINHRGFAIDRPLVDSALAMIETETTALESQVAVLTDGQVKKTTQREKLLDFFVERGFGLKDLTKETVQNALTTGYMKVDPACHRLLEIRQALSKSSTKKYQSYKNRAGHDGRCRDNLWYHGASTGRWTGVGIQVQNLPRAKLRPAQVEHAIRVIRGDERDDSVSDLEWVRTLYGNPMEVLSSCLRGVIVPGKGKVFFCADFAAIEARVCFWLAKHEEGIKAFRDNEPLYEQMASAIFGKPIQSIGKDSDERQLGKKVVLGCQFGLGYKRFYAICQQEGLTYVTETLAERAVKAYRQRHAPVAKLWGNYERAAIAAVEQPGKAFTINYTRWSYRDEFLWCQLPSGRHLAYAYPKVRYELPRWGGEERKPVLYFWSVHPETKQWCESSNWGGVWTENCFSGTTLVLTSRGWVPIEKVSKDDLLFDGIEWVKHDGVIDQGIKEIGEWAGVQATKNHLILAGESWSALMDLDENTSCEALQKGRDSVPWWLRVRVLAKALSPVAVAIAGLATRLRQECWPVGQINAQIAAIDSAARGMRQGSDTEKLCPILKSCLCGYTVIPAWCHVALTQITVLTQIMADVASPFIRRGWKTGAFSLNMRRRFRDGKAWAWISTVEKMIKGTCRETSGWLLARSTLAIGAPLAMSCTRGSGSHLWNFGSSIAPSGGAITHWSTTLKPEGRQNKLWRTTGKQEKVFDLVNCGPRNRFVVLTDLGPVIVHNCVQAVARDLMAEAMLAIEAAGWEVVLTVHDEILAEGDSNKDLAEFERLMSIVPEWALGLPIKASGWKNNRYRK